MIIICALGYILVLRLYVLVRCCSLRTAVNDVETLQNRAVAQYYFPWPDTPTRTVSSTHVRDMENTHYLLVCVIQNINYCYLFIHTFKPHYWGY